MRYRILDTPTGPFALCEERGGALRTTWIVDDDRSALAGGRSDDSLLPDLCRRLASYFDGDGDDVDFGDVPTPTATAEGHEAVFFARCWTACRAIPRGETRTYTELAVAAGGSAGAARAAGGAMRHNPLPIIVPCHRVVGSGERIGGFGGSTDPRSRALAVKRWLLSLEGALSGPSDESMLFEDAAEHVFLTPHVEGAEQRCD